jgi:perosamine synthetase
LAIHEQPVFKNMGFFTNKSCRVTERLVRHGYYIASGLALTDVQMKRAATAVCEVVQ